MRLVIKTNQIFQKFVLVKMKYIFNFQINTKLTKKINFLSEKLNIHLF